MSERIEELKREIQSLPLPDQLRLAASLIEQGKSRTGLAILERATLLLSLSIGRGE